MMSNQTTLQTLIRLRDIAKRDGWPEIEVDALQEAITLMSVCESEPIEPRVGESSAVWLGYYQEHLSWSRGRINALQARNSELEARAALLRGSVQQLLEVMIPDNQRSSGREATH